MTGLVVLAVEASCERLRDPPYVLSQTLVVVLDLLAGDVDR